MSDLTDRMRSMARSWWGSPPAVCETLVEAADHIEALEAALGEVEATSGRQEDPASVIRHLSSVARGVLAAGATPNNPNPPNKDET